MLSTSSVRRRTSSSIFICKRLVLLHPGFSFLIALDSMTSTNILLVAYGYQIKSPDDGFLKTADKSLHDFSVATTPGTFLVEFFPICTSCSSFYCCLPELPTVKYVPEWFPGAGWKKTIASFKANYEASAAEPFDFVKREMVRALILPSLFYTLMILIRLREHTCQASPAATWK